MTILEGKQKVREFGIIQLRKGETLKDALDFVDGIIKKRKGIPYKKSEYRLLNESV